MCCQKLFIILIVIGIILKPMRLRYYGTTHWWLEAENGKVIDFTSGQYKQPFPYHRGRGGGFLTKQPSRRAKEVMSLLRGVGE